MALLLRRAEKVWESDGSPRFSLAFAKLVFFGGGAILCYLLKNYILSWYYTLKRNETFHFHKRSALWVSSCYQPVVLSVIIVYTGSTWTCFVNWSSLYSRWLNHCSLTPTETLPRNTRLFVFSTLIVIFWRWEYARDPLRPNNPWTQIFLNARMCTNTQ